MTRIPITVITGFLGSGKTTLLNQILDDNHHSVHKKRIAVIENEFASAFGIENEILHQDKMEDIQNLYEFGMGCVCCSSSGELINALVEIAIRNQQQPAIEHVILETTGLADPTPILQLIATGADKKGTDDIVKNYYINGIVTLIDSKHFHQSLASLQQASSQYKNEIIAQLLTTDYIILNKVDLLTDIQEVEQIKQFIRQYNQDVKIVSTSFSKLSQHESIFDLRPDRDSNETMQMIQHSATLEALKKHDPDIEQTMLLASGGFINLDLVTQFIQKTTAKDIYRVKGVLYLEQNPDKKFIIQGVNQDQLSIVKGNNWTSDEVKESRITFIGKNVMKNCSDLESQFRACLL